MALQGCKHVSHICIFKEPFVCVKRGAGSRSNSVACPVRTHGRKAAPCVSLSMGNRCGAGSRSNSVARPVRKHGRKAAPCVSLSMGNRCGAGSRSNSVARPVRKHGRKAAPCVSFPFLWETAHRAYESSLRNQRRRRRGKLEEHGSLKWSVLSSLTRRAAFSCPRNFRRFDGRRFLQRPRRRKVDGPFEWPIYHATVLSRKILFCPLLPLDS